jgi:3D (Asp-Asp-Asp) domain-containing protein
MKAKLIASIALIGILASNTHAEYVTAPEGLRLRSAPYLEAEVIDVLPFATRVDGKVKDGWLKTEAGYLSTEYLSEKNPLDAYEALGSWLTTAYTHTGLNCANGEYPEVNYTVACNSLPIGTELYIEGIGFRTVEDRGPSNMPDEWLDIFMDGYSECVSFGEQHHRVWQIKKP